MRVKLLEVPFEIIKFESKTRRHQEFKTWAESIFAQLGMEEFSEDLGILKPMKYALFMEVERNLFDLSFLVGGQRARILSLLLGENYVRRWRTWQC